VVQVCLNVCAEEIFAFAIITEKSSAKVVLIAKKTISRTDFMTPHFCRPVKFMSERELFQEAQRLNDLLREHAITPAAAERLEQVRQALRQIQRQRHKH